ncbi:uncharacterized protein COLE_00079 [Cutaneotrichosporon oleaginosum]|uniref:uncharacterized protein n=1 Tax=Cutaneotrichosporon oleaginosum TaxID=879819 RepID=UPI00132A11D8|nr:hypothetical protein COLE_00079 [Cutaneotrichosporon oleaginosum]
MNPRPPSPSDDAWDDDVDDERILDQIELLLGSDRRRQSQRDVEIWQLEPKHMLIGSLSGNTFHQVVGRACLQKQPRPYGYKANQPKLPLSYVSFDFKRKLIVAKVSFADASNLPRVLNPLDIELPLSDITADGFHLWSQVITPNLREVRLTVAFRRPPRYFCRFDKQIVTPSGHVLFRRRATQCDFTYHHIQEAKEPIIRPVNDGRAGFPVLWNAYQWTFEMDDKQFNRLRAAKLMIQRIPDLHILSKDTSPVPVEPILRVKWVAPDLSALDFEVRVLLEGLIGTGILYPGDWPELLAELDTATASHPRDVKLRVLESLFTEERIHNIKATLRRRIRTFLTVPNIPEIKHLVPIRTVQVTPTRMLIGPPQQEASNSVTRKYSDRLHGIVRVQFVDEGDRIHVLDYARQADIAMPEVGLMARIRRALNNGICVGGQVFFPIASSGSQQKDHAIWFFDPTVIHHLELFLWIGKVTETVVAKYAARMGLPFSTSREVDIRVSLGTRADVERHGYCFTDGCSVAGAEVMWKAAEAFKRKGQVVSRPSAIQFRLGGAKGMLACWPDLAEPHQVLLRRSQVKFSSERDALSIIRTSHFQAAFLNRQFILIMEANGVPQKLFLDLFDDALTHMRGFDARIAAGAPSPDDMALLSNGTPFPLATLITSGFNTNPFVLDLCQLIKRRALADLKCRNRVQISGGVYLMGICDEVACLEEGEVFCQYQVNDNSEPVIVTGYVLVCRAPALHPGDVRRALAVDRPELRHLTNVIVFSTQGARPLPNMLGGGDLDGDDYTLIWDKRFVEPLKEFEPMNYTAPPPTRVPQVTQQHLNENFINFIMNDILGQVDNAHLATSDCLSPFHDDCLKLSEIHSVSQRLTLAGQPAQLTRELVPTTWPDFMGKEGEATSVPRSPLVDPEPAFRPTNLLKAAYALHPGLIDIFDLDVKMLRHMQVVKSRYEFDLQYTMRRFNVEEAEAVSGVPAHNRKRLGSREQRHMHEALDVVYQAHVETTRGNALKLTQDVNVPDGFTLEEYIAWHAYMLVFETRHVLRRADELDSVFSDLETSAFEDGEIRGLYVKFFRVC